MQRKALRYDKSGDQHYDYISAWIKSTRGSDPDASLYYLAAMLEGGEDARFIARRMIVLASEDIGNADPQALAARHRGGAGRRARRAAGVHVRARPGRDLPLAGAEVQRGRAGARRRPRAHPRARRRVAAPALRSAAYPAARPLGRGLGYAYPHDQPGHVNDQEHLPRGRADLRFYAPVTPSRRCASASPRSARARPGAVATPSSAAAPLPRRGGAATVVAASPRVPGAIPPPHGDRAARRARSPRAAPRRRGWPPAARISCSRSFSPRRRLARARRRRPAGARRSPPVAALARLPAPHAARPFADRRHRHRGPPASRGPSRRSRPAATLLAGNAVLLAAAQRSPRSGFGPRSCVPACPAS